MASCGDPRDWFRYGWRLEAYQRHWMEWGDARARRRDMSAGYEWDQILIIGPYGAGKTTLGIHEALKWFRKDTPYSAPPPAWWAGVWSTTRYTPTAPPSTGPCPASGR